MQPTPPPAEPSKGGTLRILVAAAIGAVVGFGLRDVVGKTAAAGDHPVRSSAAAPGAQCDMDWLRMRGEMHGVLRDTLITTLRSQALQGLLCNGPAAAVRPAGGAAAAGDATALLALTATPAPAVVASQQQARAQHAALLEAAQQRGRWTDADVLRSRQLVAAMAPADRPKALSSLAVAINGGHMKVEAAPPF